MRSIPLMLQEWYYVQNGKQNGPVNLEELRELAGSGKLNPTDLIWNREMRDWTPASEIGGIFSFDSTASTSSPTPPPTPEVDDEPTSDTRSVDEVEPGSISLDIGSILNRTFELTKTKINSILMMGAIYFSIFMIISLILSIGIDQQQLMTDLKDYFKDPANNASPFDDSTLALRMAINIVVQTIIAKYLSLGLYQCCFRILKGQPIEPKFMFASTPLFLRAIGAGLIISIAVFIGSLFFIIPGIYIAVRLSMILPAIVDKDMNIADAITYSAAITKNNLLTIFFLCAIAFVAGNAFILLTCQFGAILSIPITALGTTIIYRFLQQGPSTLEKIKNQKSII